MSAAGSDDEQFMCSICLEVFSEPVSTPCGHNYCKQCIIQTWDTSHSSFCPLCKEVFHTRPELKTNTLLAGMVSQQKIKSAATSDPKPKPVLCTFCTEPRLEAVKSCLVCLSSFCDMHLQPHLSVPGLRMHPLTLPLDNMEDRVCPKHQRPLELFCSTEHCCVCSVCALLEHKTHELISLEEACEHERASLQRTQTQNRHLMEQRRLKVQDIQGCLQLSEREAHRETAELVKVFTDIMQCVQKCVERNTKVIEQAQSQCKKQAQILISELQQEMSELEKSSNEAQHLSQSSDPLYFLQHCPTLPPAGLKDLSNMSFESPPYEGSVARALSELEHALSEKFNKSKHASSIKPQLEHALSEKFNKPKHASSIKLQMEHALSVKFNKPMHASSIKLQMEHALSEKLNKQNPAPYAKPELQILQQFAVDITLDPSTAHAELVLSKDLKQVYHSDVKKWFPHSLHRFDRCAIVLGKPSFSSGKVYFEVQVKGKTECDLGVAQESIKRKGQITASPKHGQWSICVRKSNVYYACTDPWTPLSLGSAPEKIGVFVDYGAGLVSFYDADSEDLIYSFTNCSFKDKVLPLLSPCNNNKGKNAAPLIITAVQQNKNP